MLLASSESENEENSDRENDRRERTRGSAKLGGRNETGREYANGSPSTNEDGRLIGTTKSGDKEQRGRQNTCMSVNLGGRDETAREHANDSQSPMRMVMKKGQGKDMSTRVCKRECSTMKKKIKVQMMTV